DSRKMAPTFRLQLGASGSSSAIDVAARMGLSNEVIERARELAVGAGGPLAKALHATEEERRRLQEEREALTQSLAQARADAERLSREREAFDREKRSRQLSFYEDLNAATEQAKAELNVLLTHLRQSQNAEAMAQAKAELQARVDEVQRRAAAMRAELAVGKLAQAPVQFEVGKWVHHHRLGRDVEVLEVGETDALVAAGVMKMRVPLADLGHSHTSRPQGQARFPAADKQSARLERAEKARSSTADEGVNLRADVRGMRAEEAIRQIEASFDQG